jgi:hypothetical protein
MSRNKSKKAVKKVVSLGVRWVPSAFDDDLFVEPVSQKGSFFWTLLRFDFRERRPSGSEKEFVDIDSFSDSAPEVQNEVIPDVAAGPPVAAVDSAIDSAVPQPFHPHEEASPEFVKELELTVYRGKIPSKMLLCSRFVRNCLKAKLPPLRRLRLTRALVRLTAVNY